MAVDILLQSIGGIWDIKYGHFLDRTNPESQYLFRGGRGCEDLIMVLSLTRNRLLDLQNTAAFTYNDYFFPG